MHQEQEDVHQVEYKDEHITFRSIWHAARVLREAAEKDEMNGYWSLMAANLLAYTAYEGFVNDLIQRLFPEVWEQEQTQLAGDYRGTLGKTKFLGQRLNIRLVRDARPYSTVAEVHSWRNQLVHPETARIQGTARADAYARRPKRAKPIVFSTLDRPTFVPRCFDDIPALANMLLDAAIQAKPDAVRDLGQIAFSGVLGSGGASLISGAG